MNKTHPYVPAIDGLRAIAVLAVMLYHLDSSFLPGGFAGVDVFFVISGYVVARSLSGRTGESFGSFLLGFYSRRVRRIVPALVLCLTATALLTVLFIPDSWLSSTTSQVGLYAFFGLSNLALVWFQDDYFSPRAEFNPFVHTWSLGVEEQFYFLFPLLIFLWFRSFRQPKRAPTVIIADALIPALALISLYTAFYMGQHRSDWAYYMLPARFWELAVGVILFQLQAKGRIPNLSRKYAPAILAAGLLLIGAGYAWSDVNAFPYPWAIIPVMGTMLALWSISSNDLENNWLANSLRQWPVLYVGRLSYSLYLWHWPVYTLMRWTTGLEAPLLMAAAVLFTFVLASISYHLVETPIRHARPLARPPYRAVIAGGLCITALWAGANQLFDHRSQITLSKTGNTEIWYPYAHRAEITPTRSSAQKLHGRQMFVIGNSHTGAYATMISLLEQTQGIRAQLLQTGHCALGNLLYPIRTLNGCEKTIEDYLHLLRTQANPGDMVFLASLRTHRLSDQWFRKEPETVLAYSQGEEALQKVKAAYTETNTLISRLSEMGLIVLIDAPKPVMKAPIYRCADWFNRNNPVCTDNPGTTRAFMEELRAPVVDSMQRLSANYNHVYLWDPISELCGETKCPAYDSSNNPLFFDGDHLSAHGNRVLYPSFEKRVVNIYQQCDTCPATPNELEREFDKAIELGERITFTDSSSGTQYLGSGWSSPEHWGTWSEGREAKLFLPISNGDVRIIRLEGHPLVSEVHSKQRVHIFIEGIEAVTVFLNAQSDSNFDVPIPKDVLTNLDEPKTIVLKLILPDAARPTEIGINGDPRELALGLKSLTLL